MRKLFSWWTDMEPARRQRLVKGAGLIVAVFTLFTIISIVSYLFTWKADQSLLGDPEGMNASVAVSNAAGKLGARWSHLLVCQWFGLGAFAFALVLGILSVRLLFGRRNFSVIKAVLLTLTAAIIVSLIMAYVSLLTGATLSLGGGLGGRCGAWMVASMDNLLGRILTGTIIAVLVALWFVCASTRFSRWFGALGEKEQGKEPDARKKSEKEPEQARPETTAPARKGFSWVEKKEPAAEPVPGVEPVAAAVVADPVKAVAAPSSTQSSEPSTKPVQPVEKPVQPAASHVMAGEKAPAEAPKDSSAGLEVVEGEDLSTEVTEELPRIDVRDELRDYRFPPLELLDEYENLRREVSQDELKRNNLRIRMALNTYKIEVDNVKAVVGPTVTLYKVYPAPGVKISQIRNLQEDIAMALHARGVRVVTLNDSVGIEVANDSPSIVPLRAMLNDASFRESKAELPVAIGYTITQKVRVFDLTDAPHLLVAGATKQGKSVGLNVLIASLLYSKHPSELKFVFVDPKMVEFSSYARLLKHYLAVLPSAASEADEMNNAIAKNPDQADAYLKSLCIEMDERYDLMSKALVNKVTLYNEKYKDRYLSPKDGHKYMPYIVVIVDEYADLTMTAGSGGDAKAKSRSISSSIIRLAQKGRAAGIHVVIATQRPSVDVITGLIKSNFPTRIAFRVSSMTDSRTILDSPGAEKLIGKGDMIYYAGVDMERIQCAYISNDEINDLTEFIFKQTGYKKSYNTPYYLPAPEPEQAEEGTAMIDMKNLDERFEEAAKMVVTSQRGSTSDLQRRLGMGYAKAGRVMDQLEAAGIVGPQEGSKPRQVLIADLDELEAVIQAYKNQE